MEPCVRVLCPSHSGGLLRRCKPDAHTQQMPSSVGAPLHRPRALLRLGFRRVELQRNRRQNAPGVRGNTAVQAESLRDAARSKDLETFLRGRISHLPGRPATRHSRLRRSTSASARRRQEPASGTAGPARFRAIIPVPMICPSCASDTPAPGGRCSVCSAAVSADVAAAVATPIPTDPPAAGNDGSRAGTFAAQLGHVGQASEEDLTQSSDASPIPLVDRLRRLVPGQAFGPRYQVIKLLGAGGMGEVYHAWDQELAVAVALKVIRPEATAEPGATEELHRRFKRELLLARQITHRNVVRIHDMGEFGGVKYITMPYVPGADLATILKREGKLTVPRALGIARQVAAGLAAAHEAGVVHRDLKPPNIMIDPDGNAVIMDFGIARSVDTAGSTVAGMVVGTLSYMAPEQARGEQADQRSDVYAFGLILTDMLVGRRQGGATSSELAELMARMQHAPPPIRTVDPEIPESVEHIVSRCLDPDRANRYQTMAELIEDLDRLDADGHPIRPLSPEETKRMRRSRKGRAFPAVSPKWIAIALSAIIVAGAAVALRQRLIGRPAPRPAAANQPISLAILPFRNASGDSSLDWLGPSLAEMLRTDIGRSASLRTVPSDRLHQILRDLRISADSTFDPRHASKARAVQQRGHRHLGAVPQVRQRDPDRRHARRRQEAAVHPPEGPGAQPERPSGRHRPARPVDPRWSLALLGHARGAQGHGVQAVHKIARGVARLQRRAAARPQGSAVRGAEEVPGVDPGRFGVRPRVREARSDLRQPGVRHGGRTELASRRGALRTASRAGEISHQRQPRADRQRYRQGDRGLREPRQGVAGRFRGQLRAGRPLRGFGRLRPGARPLQEGPRARSEVRRRPPGIGPRGDQGREPAGIARFPEPGPEPGHPARAGRREGRRAPRHRSRLPGAGQAGRGAAVLPGIARDQAPHRPEAWNRRDPRANRPGPGTTGQYGCRSRELQGGAADPARDRRQERNRPDPHRPRRLLLESGELRPGAAESQGRRCRSSATSATRTRKGSA